MLMVRGRHSILYDVELPSWLPADVLDAMVKRYKGYVMVQLECLKPSSSVDGKSPSHSRVPSLTGSQMSLGSSGFAIDPDQMSKELQSVRQHNALQVRLN